MSNHNDANHELHNYLNEHLKKSHFVRDQLDTQRLAFSQSLAIIFKHLIAHAPDTAPVLLSALSEIELPTEKPSVSSDRSLIARSIREEMKKPPIQNASEIVGVLFDDAPAARKSTNKR